MVESTTLQCFQPVLSPTSRSLISLSTSTDKASSTTLARAPITATPTTSVGRMASTQWSSSGFKVSFAPEIFPLSSPLASKKRR